MTHCPTAHRPRANRRYWWALLIWVLPHPVLAVPPNSLADNPRSASNGEAESIAVAIQRLTSDSYATRQRAIQRLKSSGKQALGPLQEAMNDPSLELRTQARLLVRAIHDAAVDHELERLLALEDDVDDTQLPMWIAFRRYLGQDWEARRLYGALANRYRESLMALSGDHDCQYRLPTSSRLDPQKLDRRETLAWMMVLFVDLAMTDTPSAVSSNSASVLASPLQCAGWSGSRYTSLSLRLAATLCHPRLCPRAENELRGQRDFEQGGLKRLISVWVATDQRLVRAPDRLAIAMRYGCSDEARMLCDMVLRRPSAQPRDVALGLLAAATLDHPHLGDYLKQFETDHRVAYHFQLAGTPVGFVNTQVRDIVLALRVRQSGADPREVGFAHLEADPMYVYSPLSLGFSDDAKRRQSHAGAKQIIRAFD